MSKVTRRSYGVFISVGLYLGLSILYLFAIPSGESPDEPSHLQCIEQVTQYNQIPIIEPKPAGTTWWARGRIISGLVCAHMPLYYFVTGYTQQLVQAVTQIPAHYEFPPNNPGWATGESPAMFVHPASFPPSEPLSLIILRLESIILGVVTIVTAGIVAQRIAPNLAAAPSLAMILVAGWPQFIFMSRSINNDVLATALATSVLAVLVIVWRPKRFVAASFLASLAVLSKITMVFAASAVVAVYLIEMIASPTRKQYLRPGLVSIILFSATAALILLQPTLRSNYEWSQRTIAGINPLALTLIYWGDVLSTTIQSGWARLGWMNILTPDWQALVWWCLLVLAGAYGTWKSWRTNQQNSRLVLVICGIWLLAILAGYFRINLNRFQPQFRYAFATIPVFAALAAAGLCCLTNRFVLAKRLLVPVVTVILIAANVWIIFTIVIPAYQ